MTHQVVSIVNQGRTMWGVCTCGWSESVTYRKGDMSPISYMFWSLYDHVTRGNEGEEFHPSPIPPGPPSPPDRKPDK